MFIDSIDSYVSRALQKKLKWRNILDIYFNFPKQIVNKDDVSVGYIPNKTGVWKINILRYSTIKHMTIAICSEPIKLIFMNSNPKKIMSIFKGSMRIYGTLKNGMGGYCITHPTPVYSDNFLYPTIKGVKNFQIKNAVTQAINNMPKIPEWLPEPLLKKFKLLSWNEAILNGHNTNITSASRLKSHHRFAIDEVFFNIYFLTIQRDAMHAYECKPGKLIDAFYKILKGRSIDLTESQKLSIDSIAQDMSKTKAMNRLLHGDVASGKTIVGVYASLLACDNKKKAFFIAPTISLAMQQYNFIKDLNIKGLKIALCTADSKDDPYSGDIIVGNQAIFFLDFNRISNAGIVVVDEEHKFGVSQKDTLFNKIKAHRLYLSATPIPRSSFLAKYGFFDVSNLNRVRDFDITTMVFRDSKISQVEQAIIKQVNEKNMKVYWICHDINVSLNNRIESFRKNNIEPLIMHGKVDDKQSIISQFCERGVGKLLISTTVVEVGIDVPDADVIVIENAGQFGISQLHQLRGRVGRGKKKGYCFLILKSNASETAIKRVNAIKNSSDCNYISDVDLKNRGPGDIIGNCSQAGFLFKFANEFDFNNNLVNYIRSYIKKGIDITSPAMKYGIYIYSYLSNSLNPEDELDD